MAQKIENQTKSLESLVGEMTDAAQSETGRLQLHLKTFDASEMSRKLVELWQENSRSHQFETDIAPEVLLLADRCGSNGCWEIWFPTP